VGLPKKCKCIRVSYEKLGLHILSETRKRIRVYYEKFEKLLMRCLRREAYDGLAKFL
jgi:hypothetical protein